MFSQGSQRSDSLILDDVVRLVVDWMQKRFSLANVTIELQLNSPTPFPFTTGEMEHVLMNLLDNALQALHQMPEGNGHITVKTWHEPGWIGLSVTDNGPGVPAHLQDSLFELSETSKPDGMGLGLWLARYLVDRHGGLLRLVTLEATGACFELKLPDH